MQHTSWLEFKLIFLSASLVSESSHADGSSRSLSGINQIVCFILPLIQIQKHRMWQDVVDFHFIAILQTWSASRQDGSSWLTPEHTPATCSPHYCTNQQQSKYSYLHSISSTPAKRGSSLISKTTLTSKFHFNSHHLWGLSSWLPLKWPFEPQLG